MDGGSSEDESVENAPDEPRMLGMHLVVDPRKRQRRRKYVTIDGI